MVLFSDGRGPESRPVNIVDTTMPVETMAVETMAGNCLTAHCNP
jgi:hypothetical protein